jgi:ribosomal protein S21
MTQTADNEPLTEVKMRVFFDPRLPNQKKKQKIKKKKKKKKKALHKYINSMIMGDNICRKPRG